MRVSVVIPAFNEEKSIAHVLAAIPRGIIQEIIVVNNASTDSTASVARASGATVLHELRPGYGSACLCGIAYLQENPPEIVVFLDGDFSDYPEEMPNLIAPIVEQNYGMVIGSRRLGVAESGSLTIPQKFGNWLATRLLWLWYRVKYTDLGPFRAIRFDALMSLKMEDTTYGWTVEMQLKAAKNNLRTTEIPVNYRRRIGHSKISGTLKGVVLAGYKILFTLWRYR